MPTTEIGWQHGDPDDKRRKFPKPPEGLMPSAVAAWDAWFSSWWASHWCVEDLPGLRLTVSLFDQVERGAQDPSKLKPYLEFYGLTPQARLKLHWLPPKDEAEPKPDVKPAKVTRLRVVDTA